jgi:low temperature requirement protein LtrA
VVHPPPFQRHPVVRSVLYSVVPASVWLISIVVSPPWQYVLWGLAVAVEIVLLSLLGREREWLTKALNVDHLVERVGLLVVIVFGESIFTVIAELDGHWTAPSGLVALLGFAAISMLAWIFFGRANAAVALGLQGLQQRGNIGALRDTVMYLPFLLVAGVTLFASGLGTAVAEAGHHLPLGAVVCLSAGVSLFFVASTAEALRYGDRPRDVVIWAPAGVVLPWVIVPLAPFAHSELVVTASLGVIAVLVALTEVNARRRRRGRVVPPTPGTRPPA